MERRTKITIVAVLVVLLVILALLFWPKAKPPAATAPAPTATTAPNSLGTAAPLPKQSQPPVTVTPTASAPAAPAQPDASAALLRLAATFAERYGSYSNVGDYSNLLDLRPLMTDKLAAETDAYVKAQRVQPPSTTGYFGVTTRAVNPLLLGFSDAKGTASVSVDTIREERRAGARPDEPYYQSLTVVFLKVDDAWKVDSAVWDQTKRSRM